MTEEEKTEEEKTKKKKTKKKKKKIQFAFQDKTEGSRWGLGT